MNKIYELGYSYGGSMEYAEGLMEDHKMLMIDARRSEKTGYVGWSGEALKKKFGVRYRQAGRFLGNVNYWSKGAPIKIADMATGLHGLKKYLDEGHDLILLCGCADYQACHRKVILDALAEQHTFQIVTYTPSHNIFRVAPPVPVVPIVAEQVALFDVPAERTMYL